MKQIKLLIAGAAAGLLAVTAHAMADGFRVVDGDTLKRDGVRIRLWGIDAPEPKQICERGGQQYQCGKASSAALQRLIQGQNVKCTEFYRDHYNRPVSQCKIGNIDIGRALVRQGWALDDEVYSSRYYAQTQIEARANKRGLWAGSFMHPREWRKKNRRK